MSERERVEPQAGEALPCFVRCSRCGKQVSNTVQSSLPEGIVVRAFVECPECIELKADEGRVDEWVKYPRNELQEKLVEFGYRWQAFTNDQSKDLYAKACLDAYDKEICALTAAAKDREWAEHLKTWGRVLDDTYHDRLEQLFAEIEGLPVGNINTQDEALKNYTYRWAGKAPTLAIFRMAHLNLLEGYRQEVLALKQKYLGGE